MDTNAELHDTRRTATVFQALDLDRTLFDTEKLEEVSRALVARMHPEVAFLAEQESARAIAAGTSFFIFRFLEAQLGDKEYGAYLAELKRSTQPEDFLLKGVAERIAFATSRHGWTTGVLTYGRAEDQHLKLELSGLTRMPFLATDTPDKGRVIASWQQTDGTFQLPRALGDRRVEIVTLDDDKPQAFTHMPTNSIGVLVVGKSVTMHHGVPATAQPLGIVENLHDSIAYLQTQLV